MLNRAVVECDNNIALTKARAFSRAVLLDARDKDSAGYSQMMTPHQSAVKRRVLSSHTDISPLDFSIFDKPAGNEFCSVDGDRKADSLRRQNDGCVDADDFAVGRNQRSSGISGIQRCVRLDDVID